MEDMAKHPRLLKRGNIYYARVAVPQDIKESFGKTEIWRSLRTSDYQAALLKLRTDADPHFERLFRDHREAQARLAEPPLEELTDEQVKLIGDAFFAAILEEDENERLRGFDEDEFAAYVADLEYVDSVARELNARGGRPAFVQRAFDDIVQKRGLHWRLSETSPSWSKISRSMIAASVRANDIKRQRNAGDVVETPKAEPISFASGQAKLSQVIKEWKREKSLEKGGWVASTAAANLLWAERFVDVCGDKPVDQYGKADARTFKQTLLALPPNWTKHKDLGKLSMKDAAQEAERLALTPMSLRNSNKIIGFVTALFNFAAANYDVPANPFTGLKVRISGKVRDERHPFTLEELKALFRAPLFTGCKSLKYHNTPGTIVPTDSGAYWVPLIGLFTGARSGEIIQLRLEDVREHEGVSYFQITDEGEEQNVKNAGSVRLIPIHKTLRDLGFMAFVQRQRKRKTGRLFPEM